jgi:N-acetylmuramoyl-L-alanine amidase
MNKIIIIDPGHGGLIGGEYVTAPKKMYVYPDGETVYEGVLNRRIADLLERRLYFFGIPYINLCPSELDIDLLRRAMIANTYSSHYGIENVVGISLHSNAGKGRGFEVYTSPGETISDKYATILIEEVEEEFPGWKMRKDYSDGDPDKEAEFYILTKTDSPWLLAEFGFFDNREDYEFISDLKNQEKYVNAIVESVNKML